MDLSATLRNPLPTGENRSFCLIQASIDWVRPTPCYIWEGQWFYSVSIGVNADLSREWPHRNSSTGLGHMPENPWPSNRNLPSLEGAKPWACGNLVKRPTSSHSSSSFWKVVALTVLVFPSPGSTHKRDGVLPSVTPG